MPPTPVSLLVQSILEAPLEPAAHLFLNALGLHRRYGLVLRVGPAENTVKVHYEATVTCAEVAGRGVFRLQVQKGPVYINHGLPDSLLDVMAADFGKVLHPVIADVGETGVFHRVHNAADIQGRWAAGRPAFARYYTGPLAERALSTMDAATADAHFMAQRLRHDWLFTLLCAPVYVRYQEHKASAEMHMPLVPYKPPVKFDAALAVAAQPTPNGFVRISATGACADARSAADMLAGRPAPLAPEEPGATGRVSLEYKVYPHNGTLYSATGEATLDVPGSAERRVEIELYQLNPRDPIPGKKQKTTSTIIQEVEPSSKKKGWFSGWK